MANAIEVNFEEMREFVRRAYEQHIALYIHGGIGIGKSTDVNQETKNIGLGKGKEFFEWNKISKEEKIKLIKDISYRKNKFAIIDLRGTQLADGSDVKGLPKYSEDYVEWVLNLAFKYMSLPETDGILFLDELNLTIPTVQSSLYQIINDKCIVETAINSNWGIIGAGNRAEDRAHIFDMAFPLRNRFSHIELLPPNTDDWVEDYAEPHNVKPDIIGFNLWKKDALYKVDTESNDYAYPTPRSWVLASRLLKDTDNMEMTRKVVASCVGKEMASLYVEFVELIRKLPIEEVLKKPELLKKETDLKRQCAFMIALTEKVKGNKKLFDSVFECCMYLPTELGAYLSKSIKSAVGDSDFIKRATASKHFDEFAKRYKDLIQK